ncbi:MAG: hypothetical protein ABT940_12850, partial [Alphaproteobacteria bacterium]
AGIMGQLLLVLRPFAREVEAPRDVGYTSDLEVAHALKEAFDTSRGGEAAANRRNSRGMAVVKIYHGGKMETETFQGGR